METNRTNERTHKKQLRRDEQKRGEEKAKVFENCFRSGGEENERRMSNNVMRGRRVYGGYLVCLDLAYISPATAPEILLATSLACVGFPLKRKG